MSFPGTPAWKKDVLTFWLTSIGVLVASASNANELPEIAFGPL
jgi:hypothetical protein